MGRQIIYAILALGVLTSRASPAYAEGMRLPPAAASRAHAKKRDIQCAVALDDIAFIVHKSNRMESISRQQVVDIYMGKIDAWKELKGGGGFISIINEEQGRAIFGLLEEYFLRNGKLLKDAVAIGADRRTIAAVAANPYAIGYVSMAAAIRAEAAQIDIKRLALDGAEGPAVDAKNEPSGLRRGLALAARHALSRVRKLFGFFQNGGPVGPTIVIGNCGAAEWWMQA
ncbi:MAG: substrate-binding domain-containing protein [Elusimicrobiota bacterium]